MTLYRQHLQILSERYREACDALALDTIALHSGQLTYHTNDDIAHPFRPLPLAQQWLPFDAMPNVWVIFSKHSGLSLVWPDQPDFWHVSPALPAGDWQQEWRIIPASATSLAAHLRGTAAIISHQPSSLGFGEADQLNPLALLNWLNFERAVKTDWEISQIKQANQQAVAGHKAAQKAFYAGKSEFEIHLDFLAASQQQQIEEPYGSIVALNDAAAVLHYEQKKTTAPTHHRTLLIDAGAKVNGYASDITRTITQGNAFFSELVSAMDALQQRLCSLCLPGTDYTEIHQQALTLTATLLQQTGICTLSIEEQLTRQITQIFFPHGIGHLLGLNVHDAAGLALDRDGNQATRPEHAPFLRLLRPLQTNTVVTIEPGLYFIPMLLEKLHAMANHGCDLKLIQSLKPYGGIRIEDNVVAHSQGALNLTRAYFI